MKDETRLWLAYANENLEIARLSLERDYLNACLDSGDIIPILMLNRFGDTAIFPLNYQHCTATLIHKL